MTKAKSGLQSAPEEPDLPSIEEITKKETNMNKVIALTVLATVTVIGILVATFYLGVNHQKNYEKTVEARAVQLTKQQASVKVETSKP